MNLPIFCAPRGDLVAMCCRLFLQGSSPTHIRLPPPPVQLLVFFFHTLTTICLIDREGYAMH